MSTGSKFQQTSKGTLTQFSMVVLPITFLTKWFLNLIKFKSWSSSRINHGSYPILKMPQDSVSFTPMWFLSITLGMTHFLIWELPPNVDLTLKFKASRKFHGPLRRTKTMVREFSIWSSRFHYHVLKNFWKAKRWDRQKHMCSLNTNAFWKNVSISVNIWK